jgi:hypothetical protein
MASRLAEVTLLFQEQRESVMPYAGKTLSLVCVAQCATFDDWANVSILL